MISIKRVLDRCEIGDCWTWTGGTNPDGYGRINVDGRYRAVHRIVWEALVGPVPDGLEIDHLCSVRNCANPDHLRTVTHRQNMRASKYLMRPFCRSGRHRMAGRNVYVHAATGFRSCRACKNEHSRRYNRRKANA